MKYLLLYFSLLIFHFSLYSQTETRGASVLGSKVLGKRGNTYAVIIGISNYQNIHKLQYADRDAKAFYEFLTSKSGGSVDSNNIKLLLNQQAKRENMIHTISNWLMIEKNPKKDDWVYIYFAGHGDAIPGEEDASWLLGWDVPNTDPHVAYEDNGGIDVVHLKAKIKILESTGVKVFLITDACRGNELPPGGESGAAFFNNILEQREGNNEIQFASCIKGELSQEDKIWGGGRGLFSYWFVNGLYGLADKDTDGVVTAGELSEYVKDNMKKSSNRKDASGKIQYTQVPYYCCSENEDDPISTVVTDKKKEIAELIKKYENGEQLMPSGGARGVSSLANLSDTTKRLYEKFENQVQEDTSVDYDWKNYLITYRRLSAQTAKEANRQQLMAESRDELAIALFNHSEQVMNFYVDNKKFISRSKWQGYFLSAVGCLDTALKLIDKTSEMYPIVKRNRFIFNAAVYSCSSDFEKMEPDKKLLMRQIKSLDSAKTYNSKPSAILSFAYAGLYFASVALINNGQIPANDPEATANIREALKNATEANRIAPEWPYPLILMGAIYSGSKEYEKADQCIHKALKIDSSNTLALSALGANYFAQQQNDKAVEYLNKALQYDSTNFPTLFIVGNIYLYMFQPDKANAYLTKALQFDPTSTRTLASLINAYSLQKNDEKVEYYCEKTLRLDSANQYALFNLSKVYSRKAYNQQLLADSYVKSIKFLELALNAGYKNFDAITNDSDFDNIRNTDEFKAVMKKHFPDKY